MKNSRNIKEIIDNNVITKLERMPVGASIARPHFEEHAKENVEAILITQRQQSNSLKYNQSGITLIALIVTIIVLLILASITINLTLGERGIFNTAKKAVENYKDAQEKELAELTNFEEEARNVINGIGNENLTTNILVTNIEVMPNSETIAPNETIQLTAKLLPNNATNKEIRWISSNCHS